MNLLQLPADQNSREELRTSRTGSGMTSGTDASAGTAATSVTATTPVSAAAAVPADASVPDVMPDPVLEVRNSSLEFWSAGNCNIGAANS